MNDLEDDLRTLATKLFADQQTEQAARNALEASLTEPATAPAPSPLMTAVGTAGLLDVALAAAEGEEGGLVELAAVLEESGRALAPADILASACVLAVVAAAGRSDLAGWAEGVTRGEIPAAVALVRTGPAGSGPVNAYCGAGSPAATLLVGPDDAYLAPISWEGWQPGIDPSHRLRTGTPLWSELEPLGVGPRGLALVRTLAAHQAVGAARAALERSTAYAGIRTQFGQLIGTFQAVKHLCADMFAAVESAAALAWDSARVLDDPEADDDEGRLTSAAAAALAARAALQVTESAIQVHGGIGYTWEHDLHLFLRRAAGLVSWLEPGPTAAEVTALSLTGTVRTTRYAVGPGHDAFRDTLRDFRARVDTLGAEEQAAAMVGAGYVQPHWPRPWGIAATPAEQLLVATELDGLARPDYDIAAWILPVIMEHASAEQHERLLVPSLRGELRWCQMFSEPDAGSDAAAIRTRAERVDGGWRVTGRKIWTTRAHTCDLGFATVRTSRGERKHEGLTTMVVDLRAAGVTILPLRDITGAASFNEIVLDQVFVPDADVVGEVGDGWTVARATLGSERVAVGDQAEFGGRVDLIGMYGDRIEADPARWSVIGDLLARSLALDALSTRAAWKAVHGRGSAGAEGSVAKLLRGELVQLIADTAWELNGTDAQMGDHDDVLHERFLHARMATIASGTSQITRNLIAERILGLPRGDRRPIRLSGPGAAGAARADRSPRTGPS